jgi:hypothetical protein
VSRKDRNSEIGHIGINDRVLDLELNNLKLNCVLEIQSDTSCNNGRKTPDWTQPCLSSGSEGKTTDRQS